MRWWQFKKRDADLERELRSDLELEEEEQREGGVPAEEARYAALRAFGNPTLIREQTLAVWSWNWLESLGRDLRFGAAHASSHARLYRHRHAGDGAGHWRQRRALFTAVRGVLLKPLPYGDPDSAGHALRDRNQSFGSECVHARGRGQLRRVAGRPRQGGPGAGCAVSRLQRIGGGRRASGKDRAAWCSGNLFSVLGISPALGRDIEPGDGLARRPSPCFHTDSLWKAVWRRSGDCRQDTLARCQALHSDWSAAGILSVQ